jgi:hypothetical protein
VLGCDGGKVPSRDRLTFIIKDELFICSNKYSLQSLNAPKMLREHKTDDSEKYNKNNASDPVWGHSDLHKYV